MRHAHVCLVLVAGCALTGKATPLEIRYFSPESTAPSETRTLEAPVASVRLGRVTQSSNLQYKIVHRDSNVELEPYDTLRWMERPDAYVRRALSRALFEVRPLEQAVSGRAPILDVEVIAFEEVRYAGRRAGRVRLRYQLAGDRTVLDSGVVTIERPASGPQIERVVIAIGNAMEAATSEVANRVANTMSVLRNLPMTAGGEGAP